MSVTKTYLLEGLCCPNCADAIEREVGGEAGIQSANVDFQNTAITVVFNIDEETVFQAITTIVYEIDEDIVTKRV